MPTLEGLGIHAFLTFLGSGAVLVGLLEKMVGPPGIVMMPIPLAALLLAELFFLRTRKLVHLLALETIVCSHLVCGAMFMIAIMSV